MLLRAIQKWIWRDDRRRAARLLNFAETEADGARDLARAAERTGDGLLRRLYLRHAAEEHHHAALFRDRGMALLNTLPHAHLNAPTPSVLTPGERGLDDLRVDRLSDDGLLAFLHLSESQAARRFAQYRDAIAADDATRDLFTRILADETFHMKYTAAQLARVAPQRHGRVLWKSRLGRIWKAYLRTAAGLAGLIANVVLTLQYFILVPPFAMMARWNAKRERSGWVPISRGRSLHNEY